LIIIMIFAKSTNYETPLSNFLWEVKDGSLNEILMSNNFYCRPKHHFFFK
jgi:hypothetical protein